MALAERSYRLVVHYNRSEGEAREVVDRISSSGGEAALVGSDVADAGEVKWMAGEIEDRYGHLDVFVNNAGSLIERRTFSEMTDDLWERVMAVNLESTTLAQSRTCQDNSLRLRGRLRWSQSNASASGPAGPAGPYKQHKRSLN